MMVGADDEILNAIATSMLGMTWWRLEHTKLWCHARPAHATARLQGWKLHLSATPQSAPVVLARAIHILRADPAAFKFARTTRLLADLIDARQDRGSGGKFLTIYPVDDEQCRRLAHALDEATHGLPGPGVLSDQRLRPGSLVHLRYGAFRGVRTLSNDGEVTAMLMAPDGRLEQDHRGASFRPPAWAPPVPVAVNRPRSPRPATVLLNDRYLVTKAIRHRYKGGVYRATDRRSGERVVIKQARPHVSADLYGRDVRDALRNEHDALQALRDTGLVPEAVDLFEQEGDLFLVQQEVAGVVLAQWLREQLAACDGPLALHTAVPVALSLVDAVAAVHERGYVLRDLSVNNVMLGESGPQLVDLEYLARPGQTVRRVFTPGHVAPEQRRSAYHGPAPELSADRYSLGAVLFCLVTGTAPVFAPNHATTRQRLLTWIGASIGTHPIAGLGEIAVDLMAESPDARPTLDQARHRIERLLTAASAPALTYVPAPTPPRMARDTVRYLLGSRHTDDAKHLFPVGATLTRADPLAVQAGAAGILATLTRAAHHGLDVPPHTLADIAGWISSRLTTQPRVLPGLYFGRAGTAWALLDAATHLNDPQLRTRAIEALLDLPTQCPNPDQCHGISGAGTALLHAWQVTGDAELLTRAVACAEQIVAAAHFDADDVTWPISAAFDSALRGSAHYGYGHGLAGIATFLLAVGQAANDTTWLTLAEQAGRTLRRAAHLDNGAAYFPIDRRRDEPSRLTHWCSGSSGIGTFLIRLWHHNEDPEILSLCEAAAVAVWRARWDAATTACHGLAGDGEFLLDMADFTTQDRFRHWATDLASGLAVRAGGEDGLFVPPGEDGETRHADYGTGAAGAAAFLLRLHHGGDRLWVPGPTAPNTAVRPTDEGR
ncbi:class IV lanthionine synthetase LanL [Micromonospora sediminicola]|uniref:class IV lanthionine synthetase LanL n=1 Tax=Micromonospora sediminicola TaxID=946078 RepID=UPI0037A69310